MAFVCTLSTGRSLYLDNFEGRTIVTLSSTTPGQQQQASSTFQTGAWTATPEVYLTSDGAVVKLQAERGSHYVRVHGSSIGVSEALSLDALQQMQIQQTSGVTPAPVEPMPPVTMDDMTLKMGDMTMTMNPMQMQMGNMTLRMGESIAKPSAATSQRFCSQCGAAVKQDDRFCTSCGSQLQPGIDN